MVREAAHRTLLNATSPVGHTACEAYVCDLCLCCPPSRPFISVCVGGSRPAFAERICRCPSTKYIGQILQATRPHPVQFVMHLSIGARQTAPGGRRRGMARPGGLWRGAPKSTSYLRAFWSGVGSWRRARGRRQRGWRRQVKLARSRQTHFLLPRQDARPAFFSVSAGREFACGIVDPCVTRRKQASTLPRPYLAQGAWAVTHCPANLVRDPCA